MNKKIVIMTTEEKKVTLSDTCDDETYDLDVRCTDYGETIVFFD